MNITIDDALDRADTNGLMNGAEEHYTDVYEDAGFSSETLTSSAINHPCQLTVGFLMQGDYDA